MKNKRNLKRIKLIAGTLALSAALSACSVKNNDERTPETVYVYVTATPTPCEYHENSNSYSTTNSGVLRDALNNNTVPSSETIDDDELWADDSWFFFSDDPYMLPTIETDPDEEELDDSEIDSLLSIYNFFARVDNSINNFDYEETRDEAIEEVRQLIDFIFYGAEMNGTTFQELTEQGRQAAYERLQSLDARIMEYDPDYKTRLGELYNRVRSFIITTYENARDAFNSHIDIDVDVNVYPNEETTQSTMNATRERKSLKLKK